MSQVILLDGSTLTPDTLYQLSQPGYSIDLTPESWNKVQASRDFIEEIISSKQVAYGVNTGFGIHANQTIDNDKLVELQHNLIRSHCAGVGEPLSPQTTKMLIALRVNVIAKGNSGIRPVLLQKMIEYYNKDCLPYVPKRGTVGASGDLAPLAHLALGILGEGQLWDEDTKSYKPTMEVLQSKFQIEKDVSPIESLQAKEGLSMINGAQMISTILTEALIRSENAAKTADVIATLTLEVLRGRSDATHPLIHQNRPHEGQIETAHRMRQLLIIENQISELCQNHGNKKNVQDAYSLRCIPQVHGIVHDTLKFIRKILTTELNSACDNPMVILSETEGNFVVSCGNFHGEYPAKLSDYLAIAVHELSSISETRIARLMHTDNSGLPDFLVHNNGLNTGLMIVHSAATSLVSENKALCHAASIDTIPTSAGQEDHVSMGGWAARKALKVVKNVEKVLAIELLANCQALDLLRPLKSTKPLEAVHQLVRQRVEKFEQDRSFWQDIQSLQDLIRSGEIIEAVSEYLG